MEGDAQHELLLGAARRLGVGITDVSPAMGRRAALLEHCGRVELMVQGIIVSAVNLRTKHLCDHKQLTKGVFARLGIPCAQSVLFSRPDDPAVADLLRSGGRYVCKPQSATNGIGVETEITDLSRVHDYWQRNRHLDQAFLLEEQVDGTDLRIQVIGGEAVACCLRLPAHVVGDGRRTLHALVAARREEIRGQNPSNRLDLDHVSHALLAEQGLGLDDVPEVDRRVRLKAVANMGQGGHAVDVSEEIHPRYRDWVARLVGFFDAGTFALDLICQQPEMDPAAGARALEINAMPEWLHHTFSERRTHDLATRVLRSTFALPLPSEPS